MEYRILKQQYDRNHNRIMQILKAQEKIVDLLQKHYQEYYVKGKSAARMYYTTYGLLEAKYAREDDKQRELVKLLME